MTEHSLKPWRVARTSRGILQIRDSHDKCVAMFDWHKDRTADARLIASAPDLLEALQVLLKEFDSQFHPYEDQECQINAHKAIAKATGESK